MYKAPKRDWSRIDGIDLMRGLSILFVLMNHVNMRLLGAKVPYLKGLVEFLAVDMPSANRFVVHILAPVAEQKAEAISKRTKAALAAAKERGTVLSGRRVSAKRFAQIGTAARQTFSAQAVKRRALVLPVIAEIQGQGIATLRAIASELNAREVDAPRGGQWGAVQVQRVLK